MGDGSMLDGVLAGIEWRLVPAPHRRRPPSSTPARSSAGERVVVGVNRFTDGSAVDGAGPAVIDHRLEADGDGDEGGEERQRRRLAERAGAAATTEAVAAVLARVTADARRPDVNLHARAHRRGAGLRHRGRDRALPWATCSGTGLGEGLPA